MSAKKTIRFLEKRIETVEKVQTDGVDCLVNEIKRLFHNDDVIGEAVEQHDTTIAALKALLIDKGIITEREVLDKRKEIDQIRVKAMEARKKEAELCYVAEQAKKAALEERGYPPEAFIYGG